MKLNTYQLLASLIRSIVQKISNWFFWGSGYIYLFTSGVINPVFCDFSKIFMNIFLSI